MELLHLERECLRVLVAEYERIFTEVSIDQVSNHFTGVPYAEMLSTLEKLQVLGLVRMIGNQDAKRHRMLLLLPTGKTHLYLEGRLAPVKPGHMEVVVQFDRSSAAQLCEAMSDLVWGQDDLVAAVRSIADELRKPPEASTADKIQAATSVLSLAGDAFPLISTVLLPTILRLTSGG